VLTAGFLRFSTVEVGITDISAGYNIEIDRITRAEWSAVLRDFADASIYQAWSYGAVRWGEKNLSHLILKRDDQILGLAQAAIRSVPLFKAGIAYVPWGPIWRRKDEETDPRVFQILVGGLKEEYAGRRKLQLRIAPNVVDADAPGFREFLDHEEFRPSGKIYRTLVLDLKPSLMDLRKGLDQKWRNQLNRSEKNGLQIVEGTSDELYASFRRLYEEMVARKGFETFVDVDEFGRIQAELEDASKMMVMLCLVDNEPVAGLVGSAIGDTGIYLLGATNDAGMKAKGSNLLQWRFIEWLKERDCRWYDLGGIDPEGNPGVYHFKSGVSHNSVHHVGQFEICNNYLSSFAVSLEVGIRSAADQMRSLIRKRLNKE
jgi:lipid II:glycine glycyltransferase (peptidoglycan interpeptide bridge formation enzyme)